MILVDWLNFLDEQGHVKLADFGLAKEGIGNDDLARSFCGSPAYLSPEMVKRRGVGKAADIYGIGKNKSPYLLFIEIQ